jgi:hypothetical protein
MVFYGMCGYRLDEMGSMAMAFRSMPREPDHKPVVSARNRASSDRGAPKTIGAAR